MGTRNITRVISRGELKVCQYCQWDGYPTGVGLDIVDFVRSSDDERMVERLDHVTLATPEKGTSTFFTGGPVDGLMEEISDALRTSEPYASFAELWAVQRQKIVERFGAEAARRYCLSTRDMGPGVLGIIYGCDDDLTLWTTDYLRDNDGDWQIEAVWELDYDHQALKGNWHDQARTWTFAELRSKDMVSEMSDFEESGWQKDLMTDEPALSGRR